MKRRRFLHAALIGALGLVSSGHTPYRQWMVYRQRHLLILTDRSDPPSYPLGKQVAAVLATHLPASKARVTRAPHTERIASLISSKQLDVALMSPPDAVALAAGLPPFEAYGPVALRTLLSVDGYLLVCRDDFPARACLRRYPNPGPAPRRVAAGSGGRCGAAAYPLASRRACLFQGGATA